MPLAQPLRIDPPGQRGQLLEGGDPEGPEPLEQPVQDVDGRARVVQGAVRGRRGGAEERRQRGELAVGHLVARQQAPGQDGGVDRGRDAGQAMPFSAQAALRNPRSNGALCATRTAPRANSRKPGSTAPMRGAAATIIVVMPVSTLM